MNLSLLPEEINVIESLLFRSLAPSWVKESITKKVVAARKEEQKRETCDHKSGVYRGTKTCCVYCGGYSIGEGESWDLEETK